MRHDRQLTETSETVFELRQEVKAAGLTKEQPAPTAASKVARAGTTSPNRPNVRMRRPAWRFEPQASFSRSGRLILCRPGSENADQAALASAVRTTRLIIEEYG